MALGRVPRGARVDQKWTKNGSWRGPGGPKNGSWRGPGVPWEAPGGQYQKRVAALSFLEAGTRFLEASWGCLGASWGLSWGLLGLSWSRLGHLGAVLASKS